MHELMIKDHMFKINKHTEYALMALSYLNRHDSPIGAKVLSHELSIPFDPLSKVLQILKRNQIISSTRGIKGGYVLDCELKEISLFQLSKLIEGDWPHQCGPDECHYFSTCHIKKPVTHLHNMMGQVFQKITINQFLKTNYEIHV